MFIDIEIIGVKIIFLKLEELDFWNSFFGISSPLVKFIIDRGNIFAAEVEINTPTSENILLIKNDPTTINEMYFIKSLLPKVSRERNNVVGMAKINVAIIEVDSGYRCFMDWIF